MDCQYRYFPLVSIRINYGFERLLIHFHSLFILSLYKSEDPETQRMKWLFQTDYSGTKFPKNLRKPTLDALRTEPHRGEVPIITANRIFVTVTVVIFGLTKATLAYGGLNTAANTLDWILGIIISSMHVPPTFFPPKTNSFALIGLTVWKCTKTPEPMRGQPSSWPTISLFLSQVGYFTTRAMYFY